MAVSVSTTSKSIADPLPAYRSLYPLWIKSRAVCSGERFVKEYDGALDVFNFNNLLIPFSPSMTIEQYRFYRSEAELPGIVSQYAKALIGGLLRKKPQLELPEDAPPEISEWILNEFSSDDGSLVSFLAEALTEEVQTGRAWVYIDYPKIDNVEDFTTQEIRENYKPYPVLWNAESVINWKVGKDQYGKNILTRVICRVYEEVYDEENNDAVHPQYLDTIYIHEIINGYYQIRKFQDKNEDKTILMVNGKLQQEYANATSKGTDQYTLIDTNTNIIANGKRLTFIPAWPLNGSIQPQEPLLMPLIDREIALYNKVSRRNHLMYGAATYTPIIADNISDEEFDDIVKGGLGTWIKLNQGGSASVLETPTEALRDMEAAIANAYIEMAKIGIRMLSPEADQSGVALELRNAIQTAQLGLLNTKVSTTLAAIITFMINWRYGVELSVSEVKCELSADFNPTPLGSDWLRLATEWYQGGLIPRSIWLQILKINDMIPPEYDDEEGQKEIAQDTNVIPPAEQFRQEQEIAAMQASGNVTQLPKKGTSNG